MSLNSPDIAYYDVVLPVQFAGSDEVRRNSNGGLMNTMAHRLGNVRPEYCHGCRCRVRTHAPRGQRNAQQRCRRARYGYNRLFAADGQV